MSLWGQHAQPSLHITPLTLCVTGSCLRQPLTVDVASGRGAGVDDLSQVDAEHEATRDAHVRFGIDVGDGRSARGGQGKEIGLVTSIESNLHV